MHHHSEKTDEYRILTLEREVRRSLRTRAEGENQELNVNDEKDKNQRMNQTNSNTNVNEGISKEADPEN